MFPEVSASRLTSTEPLSSEIGESGEQSSAISPTTRNSVLSAAMGSFATARRGGGAEASLARSATPLPITGNESARLHAMDPDALQAAHEALTANGYSFVGYHGTNMAGMKNLVPSGFDPKHLGESSGLERGPGFYVARHEGLASDFGENATLSDVEKTDRRGNPIGYENKPGDAGQQALLRIYAHNFESMKPGSDYSWGVMATGAHDQNGDLGIGLRPGEKPTPDHQIPSADSGKMAQWSHDMEMVFSAGSYPRLAALPVTEGTTHNPRPAAWRPFEDGDRPNVPSAQPPRRRTTL